MAWSLNRNTGVLTVMGTGAMSDYQDGTAPWWGYRHEIRQVVIEGGVTHVGEHAFASYDNLMGENGPRLSGGRGSVSSLQDSYLWATTS